MKKLILVTATLCAIALSSSSLIAKESFVNDLPSSCIEAEGWAREFLVRQEQGLGSHPEESGFPFNTKMWEEDMDVAGDEFQYYRSPWWPFEHTAYYLDGTLRGAYYVNSESQMQRVEANLKHFLESADVNGRLHAGTIGIDQEWWPITVMMRMVIEQYESTQDEDLLAILERHFKYVFSLDSSYDVPGNAGFFIRHVLQVEQLCQMYGITGDKWYLDSAERLYAAFQEKADNAGGIMLEISAKGMAQELESTGHGVTYSEFLKLPAILYNYTHKEFYKDAIYGAFKQLQENHELADGLHSSSENCAGKGPEKGHETCNAVDFNWSAGWALIATEDPMFADKMEKVLYNAGFSSLTKDFRAHQYFSLPNSTISTSMSAAYDDECDWGFGSKGRFCYKPGHDTQCCTGNIHRIFPTFLNRTCLIVDNDVKLMFYLPTTINIPIEGELFSFTQKTNYPFEHMSEIIINSAPKSKVDFSLRIPGWADSYTVTLNGETFATGDVGCKFETVSRKFKRGDKIKVEFKTTPKIDDRGAGVAINYGPLLFSEPIEYKKRLTTSDFAGKCSIEFPAYELYPLHLHDWAFALSKDLKAEDIEVVESGKIGYPWDETMSPIVLKVNARAVKNWGYIDWLTPAAFPEQIDLGDEKTLYLQPMGSTLLRIAEFPKGDF